MGNSFDNSTADTNAYGGNGGSAFRTSCPPGSYIKSLKASSGGKYVDNISGECSDGSFIKMLGTDLKGDGTSYTTYGPFNKINVRTGEYVDNIFGIVGGPGGISNTIQCNDDSSLVGLYGQSGSIIDKIGGICGIPADLPTQGGPGGSPFRQKCPDTTYLKKLYGVHNSKYVTAVGGQCSDGTKLTMFGDGTHYSAEDKDFSYDGPFDFMSLRSDNKYVNKIYDSGGNEGYPRALRCPAGRKVTGYYGRSGSLIDQFGVMCGSVIEPEVPQVLPPYVVPPVNPSTDVVYATSVTPQVLPPVSSYVPVQLSPSALTPIIPPTNTVITVPATPLSNLNAAIPYNPNNLVSNTSNVGLSGGASVNTLSNTSASYNAGVSGTTPGTTLTPGSTLNLGVFGGAQTNANTTTNSSVSGTVTNSVTTNNPPTVTVTTDTTKSDNTILYILFGLLFLIVVAVTISSFVWKSNQSNQANSNKRR